MTKIITTFVQQSIFGRNRFMSAKELTEQKKICFGLQVMEKQIAGPGMPVVQSVFPLRTLHRVLDEGFFCVSACGSVWPFRFQ